jgi:CRP-like cAMP-binding protein
MDDRVVFEEGQVIFAERDRGDCIYIVDQGEVLLLKEEGSRMAPVTIIKNGEFIGELSAFGGSPIRNASAVAIDQTFAYVIKTDDIQTVIKKCPAWVREIMQTLSDRLRTSTDVMTEHRIVDESLENFTGLNPEKLLMYRDKIDIFRKNKGRK